MANPKEIKIRLVNRQIVCGEKGGTVRRSSSSHVKWSSEYRFRLEFFYVEPEEERDSKPPSRWPFAKPAKEPAGGVFGDSKQPFEGELLKRADSGYVGIYKYHVTVFTEDGDHFLDPIIIMD